MAEADDQRFEKVYRYRKHIKFFQYAVVVVLGLLTVGWMGLDVLRYFMLGEFSVGSLVFTLIIGLEALVIFYFMRKMSTLQVMLTEHAIIKRDLRGDTTIAYADVEKLGFPSLKFLGGWMTVETADEKLRLTAVLADLDDFVLTLKERMEAHGRQDAYDHDRLASFYAMAAMSRHNWDRFYTYVRPVMLSVGAAILLGAFAGWMVAGGSAGVFRGAVTGGTVPGLLYMVADTVMMLRVSRRLQGADAFAKTEPDLSADRSAMRLLFWVGLPVTLASIILVPLHWPF